MPSPTITAEDAANLRDHIDEAIRHADSLVGRAVSLIADPISCGLEDTEEVARLAGQLRNALCAALCLAPRVVETEQEAAVQS